MPGSIMDNYNKVISTIALHKCDSFMHILHKPRYPSPTGNELFGECAFGIRQPGRAMRRR